MNKISWIVICLITNVAFIDSSEPSPAVLPVKFINRTRFTIAAEQPGQRKNSLILSPYYEIPDEQIGDNDSEQEISLQFHKSHKALDGIIYKANIQMQAMDLNPPFYKGPIDKWIVYYKLVADNHPEKLIYTVYEHNSNIPCDVFVLSNMIAGFAYRDVTFTKILSKL